MTKNLRIVGKTITPEDSDIEEGTFDIPNNQPIDFKTTSADTTANHAYLDEEHGGLYTWACATAGSGDSLSGAGQIAPHSIAPKGWKMITAADMQGLLTAYGIEDNVAGSTKLRESPLNFEYGQYVAMTSGTIYHGIDEGMYWYSDVTSTTQAKSLDIIASRVYSKPNNRPYGFSVRCILRTGGGSMRPIIEQLKYMQDVTIYDFDILAASMELEKVYTLIDKRDGTPYDIALLKDGNIWMVENLRIANYLCTPEDSDITDGSYQIPASDIKSIRSDNHGAGVYIDETYGGYYNYFAATAGEVGIMDSTDATQSILPKGWKLANQDEWTSLVNAYGGDEGGAAEKLVAPPLNFTLSGNVGDGTLQNTNTVGRFTGSTHDPTTIQKFYGLYLNTSNDRAIVLWGHNKAVGIAVRGIVRKKEE